MASVLLGIITYSGERYCRETVMRYIASLTTPLDVLIVTNSGEEDRLDLEKAVAPIRAAGKTVSVLTNYATDGTKLDQIVANRNKVREEFLRGKWEWLFFLDSDLIGPTNMIDVMLKHEKKVVTGWYLGVTKRDDKPVIKPVAYVFDRPGFVRQLLVKHVLQPRFMPIAAAGLGCCLMHRSLLEKISFRREEGSEDALFFQDVREQGEELWLDTRVKFWHLKFPPGDPKNNMYDPRRYKKK